MDKQITDNEGAIKKYILDLAKFEKLELDENNIEKIIKELKVIIKKYSGRKAGNTESKFPKYGICSRWENTNHHCR